VTSPPGWVYEGWVRHRREAPVRHEFRYRVFQLYLDLDRAHEALDPYLLWSARRPAFAWLRRSDHHGDPSVSLADATRDLVEARTGSRPGGPVRLLTHLRYCGYVMNPVSIFYCWDEADRHLQAIVAEVHNTPWGERHCYVLEPEVPKEDERASTMRFRFPKEFHVSPFMGMDQAYDWRFGLPGARLMVHMENLEGGCRIFDATMVLRRQSLSAANLRRVLIRYPLMTVQVITAIYWQALRLWWRRCPFHPHPEAAASRRDPDSSPPNPPPDETDR